MHFPLVHPAVRVLQPIPADVGRSRTSVRVVSMPLDYACLYNVAGGAQFLIKNKLKTNKQAETGRPRNSETVTFLMWIYAVFLFCTIYESSCLKAYDEDTSPC